MITKKLRIFHPRPNNFVIVNCETITLLTRGLFPDGQTPTTTSNRRSSARLFTNAARVTSAQAKSDHLDDEMSCRMVREVCWWCACRASGGAHLVCVSPGAHFCVAGCTFRRPGGHFLRRPGGGVRLVCVSGSPGAILVVRMVILIDFSSF